MLVGVCRFSGNHCLLTWILVGWKFVHAVSSKCVCFMCVYVHAVHVCVKVPFSASGVSCIV